MMKNVFLLSGFVVATVAVTKASDTNLERAVIRLAEFDRAIEHSVVLAPDYRETAVVSIQRVGDHETLSSGFAISEPMDFRVIAMGEGMGREMYDYGWIVDASSHETVWSMEYSHTYRAGGASKNRVVDEVVQLHPGAYIAYYTTDGSHSFNDWNSAAPPNPELWGLTVIPSTGDREAVSSYDPEDSENFLARIVRVGDNQTRRSTFTLDRGATVSVYSIGEGSGGEMYDYASIQRADNHQTVWRMEYRNTSWAGGARKNRMANQEITLPAGDYLLTYESDGSHSFGDWNSEAPHDAANWGVTVSLR